MDCKVQHVADANRYWRLLILAYIFFNSVRQTALLERSHMREFNFVTASSGPSAKAFKISCLGTLHS